MTSHWHMTSWILDDDGSRRYRTTGNAALFREAVQPFMARTPLVADFGAYAFRVPGDTPQWVCEWRCAGC